MVFPTRETELKPGTSRYSPVADCKPDFTAYVLPAADRARGPVNAEGKWGRPMEEGNYFSNNPLYIAYPCK